MLPLTRNDTLKTPRKLKTPGKLKSPGSPKTAGKPKTPGKMLPPLTVKRITGTIKKQPLNIASQSFNSTRKSPKVNKHTDRSLVPRSTETSFMQQTSGSIDNNTFSILNFSSSTEVDVPSNVTFELQHKLSETFGQPNFSPLMRKIEEAMDTKFMSFMETPKNEQRTMDMTHFQDTMRNAVNQSIAESLLEEPEMVRTIMTMLINSLIFLLFDLR